MKQLFAVVTLAMFVTLGVNAQHLELGLMGGASSYAGDLSKDDNYFSTGNYHAAGGVFAKYNFSKWGAIRLGFNYAKISAEDAENTNVDIQNRNLSFRNNIWEFGLTGEFNVLGYQPYNLERTFSPYVFGGIAAFKHNPQALYNGEWVDLQPLGTEGQGTSASDKDPYKLFQVAVPFGAGLKYAINDRWNIGAEFGIRMTFTDYLDDVSGQYADLNVIRAENGDVAAALSNRTGELTGAEPLNLVGRNRGVENQDWYYISGITISYNFLDTGLVGSRGRNNSNNGCFEF